MRKIRYSVGVKAMMLTLQELCAVMLVVCSVMASILFESSMLDFRAMRNQSFWSSGNYNALFERALKDLLNYQVCRGWFETDGSYNPEKAVNVIAYMDTHVGNRSQGKLAESEAFRYYLKDLESWSKKYHATVCRVESRLFIDENGTLLERQRLFVGGSMVQEAEHEIQHLMDLGDSMLELLVTNAKYYYGGDYSLNDYQKNVINSVGNNVYSEMIEGQALDAAASEGSGEEPGAEMDVAVQKVRDGRLFQLSLKELKLILESLEMLDSVAYAEFRGIQEEFMTVDGSGILRQRIEGELTLEEMQQAYEGLSYTLNSIGDEINSYRWLASYWSQEESNCKFLIYDEAQGQYYGNLPDSMEGGNLTEYGKSLGSFFYYNQAEPRLNTNVPGMEEEFHNNMNGYLGAGNQLIFLGVDKALPLEDSWKWAKQEYEMMQPWATVSLLLAVISACGLFLSFVYLGVAAGRCPGDDRIRLLWLDRLPTEFLIASFGILGIGCVFMVGAMVYVADSGDAVGMMVVDGGAVFSFVFLFDILYMSFARKAKSGILWEQSLLYWLMRSVRKLMANWRPSLRIALAFLLHVGAIFLMGALLVRSAYQGDVAMRICLIALFFLLCAWEARHLLREAISRNALIDGIRQIAAGDLEYKVYTESMKGDYKVMGEAVNTIGEGLFRAVDAGVKNERLKADLITNVSHDIKTPLTSIINYVGLLRRENLKNERAMGYIQILDAKSQRLKQLTEDLVEVSRISSGNITLQMGRLNLVELVYQSAGEFGETFEERKLTVVAKLPTEPVVILADGRRIWRVLENLYQNVAKYAMENTRVYIDMEALGNQAVFSIKNISRQPLNIDASELTERFIRGDVSRSTEGSGLGLSIAQNLTSLMGGEFRIYLDGDLFKVTVTFPIVGGKEEIQ